MAKGNAGSAGDGRTGGELRAAAGRTPKADTAARGAAPADGPERAGGSAAKSASGSTGAAKQPGGTARKSAGAAKKSAGATKKSAGAAKKSAGAAKKSAGAAKKSAGAAKKSSGAAKKSAGAAKKSSGAAKKGAGGGGAGGGASDLRGELRGFVRQHPDGWGHDEWRGLVDQLRQSGHDTSDGDRLGMHLENERLADRLEGVKGLGPQKVRSLVDRFGTLYSMRNADTDAIVRAGKVSREVADRIKDRLG